MKAPTLGLVVATALSLPLAVQAQVAANSSPSPISLADALDYARLHYPSVSAALAEKATAESDVSVAKTAYLPQVNLLWQINRSTINNFAGVFLPQSVIPPISGPVLPQSGQSAWNSGAGVLVSWRPFDFGVRAARVDAARDLEAAANEGVALTELQVVTATGDAYMNLAAAESLVTVAQANLDRLHAFSLTTKVLVDNKLHPGVEAQQAEAAEAAARITLVSVLNNVEAEKATLAKLVARPVNEISIDDHLLLTSSPPPGAEARPVAVDGHPAALEEAARVKAQSAQLRAIDRSYAPQFDVLGSASTRGSGKSAAGAYLGGTSGLEPNIGNWSIGFQVTLPLGSFPTLHAQQQEQRAKVEAERDRYLQTLGDLNEQLEQALASLRAARKIAELTPEALAAARQSEAQQRVRFQSGLATVVDVTVAEAALAQAESQNAIARLNIWRALATLAAAEGDTAQFRAALAPN